MACITVSKLGKSFGTQQVLENISFQVEEKDKIGIIGNNGSGKSTLMKLLVGELEADTGTISKLTNIPFGYLEQNVHNTSQSTVYEVCLKAYEEAFQIEEKLKELEGQMAEVAHHPKDLERVMSEYQYYMERFEQEGGLSYSSEIRGMLKGMGFREDQDDQSVESLSGGEKSRLELASLLLGRPRLLFLDEPTNHLDMEAIRFLENFLKDFSGACLLISHDRYFINKVCSRIFLVEHKGLVAYDCGYQEYSKRRKKDLEIYARAYNNQQKEIARQKEIIERLSHLGGSKRKRGISQSRSRQKLLDKMELLEKPKEEVEHMKLRFTPKYESGFDVLELEDVSKSYGERQLFQDVSFSIFKGDCMGLVGENGVGKTTLFRLILGQEEKDSGRIAFGSSVKFSFFDQEQRTLDDELTILDELWDAYPQLDHYQVRSYLAKFQFVGDDVFRLVGECSGGEKARLALLKLMLSSANFLLLDEPTNHLDIESREILEEALLEYEGTILVISHDRYFLNHVCNKIVELSPRGTSQYLGNYDYYLDQLEKQKEASVETSETKTSRKKSQKVMQEIQKKKRSLQQKAERLHEEIEKSEERVKLLQDQSYQPEIYQDPLKAYELQEEIKSLEELILEKTDAWFALLEEMEEL